MRARLRTTAVLGAVVTMGGTLGALGLLATACRGGSHAGPGNAGVGEAAAPRAASEAGAEAQASSPPPAWDSGPPGEAGPAAALPLARDAGPGCRVLRAAVELPVRSAAALEVRGDTLEAVVNDDGKPRPVLFPAGPVELVRASPAPDAAAETVASVAGYALPCAIAADRVFCPDRSGAVHRWARDVTGDRVVGSSRAGSRISAAALGGSHPALAYLASRQTSEGWVSEAWLAVDEAPPVRLSEDGSGATSVVLAPRGAALLAIAVDARAALTALHARPITFEAGGAHLGEDAVVFVGGPGDRRTGVAVAAPAAGPAWALLPIARDIGSFGLAMVRVDDPPRVDEPVAWSMYPNGLDPAPVTATAAGGRTWAARVVPRDATPGAARALELGEIDGSGGFVLRDVLPTGSRPSEVSLAADGHGGLWVAWVEPGKSWIARVACGAGK